MTTETLALAETQTRLAGARVPCPKHAPAESFSVRNRLRVQCNCIDGRVYFLPEAVRVPCPKCDGKGAGWKGRYDAPRVVECPECEGRGWVVATDGWVWWQAIWEVGIDFEMTTHFSPKCDPAPKFTTSAAPPKSNNYKAGDDDDPEVAFFTVLERAMGQVEGIEF